MAKWIKIWLYLYCGILGYIAKGNTTTFAVIPPWDIRLLTKILLHLPTNHDCWFFTFRLSNRLRLWAIHGYPNLIVKSHPIWAHHSSPSAAFSLTFINLGNVHLRLSASLRPGETNVKALQKLAGCLKQGPPWITTNIHQQRNLALCLYPVFCWGTTWHHRHRSQKLTAQDPQDRARGGRIESSKEAPRIEPSESRKTWAYFCRKLDKTVTKHMETSIILR